MQGVRLITGILMMAFAVHGCYGVRERLHPIVLVPGSGGNQLEGKLSEKYKPSSLLCRPWGREKNEWFRLWFDISVIIPSFTKCFAERMTLYYDPKAKDYHNAPGVETRVPHFGSVLSLRYLDPNLKHITAYMEPLISSIEDIGYIDEENLFGAPYDFRYGLNSSVGSKFLKDLKTLIENAYFSNGEVPTILISHSLGGLWVLRLLCQNPMSWRQKYVKHFIALSAPWGGTVQELITFASGYTLGVPLVDPLLVRGEQRSSESNMWLLPSPRIFGHRSLVITPNKTYSAKNMPQFLEDIGFSQGVEPYIKRVLPITGELPAPGVPVTCLIGSGIETPETLFYERSEFDTQPAVVNGDGDGTVNMVSLLAAFEEWSSVEEQVVKVVKFPGVSHTSILKVDESLRKIVSEISRINSLSLSSVIRFGRA
ncbi:lecithin-cholesterol acyltransferase-like 1 isoform X2 [Amborella trichopoda]|nr:lecithin-cholesterol acyltransferase-like 1 isoform X2 [Amborella trichopoda]|eukprot:XP_011628030.1 lecithin-cholesterol acyltransferase-like 1 isoform X2 [Amborella trichopoda]